MKSKREFLFYVDDSGSRDPDRKPRVDQRDPDWFALGGVILDSKDKDQCDLAIANFRKSWPQMGDQPLHSYDIRNKSAGFRWLTGLSEEDSKNFYQGISALVVSLPIIVTGCVVDRPGYNARYLAQYGQRRWKLCRTAFNIAVERAAKFATHHDARLRVFVERTDRKTEAQFKKYFDELKGAGTPFDPVRSAKYGPLEPDVLARTLYEFKVKTKASDLMQLADLCLWPICSGAYQSNNKAFGVLKEARKLLDDHCTPENGLHGIKYSCFDALGPETQKPAFLRA